MADNDGLPIQPVDDSVFDQYLAPQDTASVGEAPASQPSTSPQLPTDSIFDPYIQNELKEAKYDNTEDMAKAFAQGLGKGAAGPLSPLALRAAGANVEEMRAREEQHPYLTGAGEIAGLVGTGIAGKGLGAALGAIGKIAEVGEGAGTLAKIGSMAAKGALENVAFQTSDELSKLVLSDPNQSMASALADIGAAGVLGSAFGAGIGGGGALWDAAKGSDTAKVLKTLVNKAGGIEGETLSDAVQSTIDRSGIELDPVLKGALSEDPVFSEMFNTLRQTDTSSSGREVQKIYNNTRQKAADAMVESLGRTPRDVESLGDMSKYEIGKSIGNTLADEYESQVKPIASRFDKYREKYGKVELQPDVTLPTGDVIPGTMSQTVDKIAQLAIDQGWTTSPSSEIMREVNRVMKELPQQKTIRDVTNYTSQIGQNTWDINNPALRRAGHMMKDIVKEAEAGAIVNKIGITEGAEAVSDFAKARADYATQSALKDALNDRLHIKGANTSNFANVLREMGKTDGEAIYNRLSGKGDANLLEFLSQNYPNAANTVKSMHLDQLLKKAADKAAPGMTISGETLAREIKKLSPELQRFIAPEASLNRINAIDELLGKFNTHPYNFSNTARTFDKMMEYVPSTVTGMITALATHNPALGGVVGMLTKYIGKEVPDAIKLGLLKFMGTNKAINPAAFKTSIDLIHSIQKGEQILNKGAKSVFNVSSESAIKGWTPSVSDRIKLDKVALQSQDDPEMVAKNGDSVSHYMPEHGMQISATAARIVSYLQANRPGSDPKAPLDSKMQISPIQKAEYDKVLDIALNPMIIMDKVKSGSVTIKDIDAVKSMYPDLFNRMVNKLSVEMTEAVAKNKTIPYKTRIGVSLMMGQPMDSTMSPASFAVTQTISTAPQMQPQMPQDQRSQQPKGSPSSPALQKLPGAYKTAEQARMERMQRDK